jgi:rubredoxin
MDKLYTCERCGYETNRISNIKTHFQRKKPCLDANQCGKTCCQLLEQLSSPSVIEEELYKCDGCGMAFQSTQGRSRHLISCKDFEILNLRREIQELKSKEPSTSNITHNITNNNITTNNNCNNITIVLNDFGSEDVSHVSNDTNFLDKCLRELSTSAIENLVERMYYHDDHPENKNVLMKSMKQNIVMVRTDGKWKQMHPNTPATKMVHKGKKILHSYYVESGKQQEEMNKLVEEGDLTPEDKKLSYLLKLGIPNTNEHKVAVSKVKGVISNYKFT